MKTQNMKKGLSFLAAVLCVGLVQTQAQSSFDGYALYNKSNQNTAYLIDKDGNIAHSWSCAESCNYAVKLKDDGNILRGATVSGASFSGGAVGGLIQELDASANVVWEYLYSDADHCAHHDFCPLPNGNVILGAWESKTAAECTQAGVNGASSDHWPTHFIELQPDGAGSATIIWEWHIWDHMIQDFDVSKDNYGVVADHPELMDINAISPSGGGPGPGGSSGDWYHVNGISHNEALDQLVFTSRTASEFFIIDHSTTAAEAASHSGGNSGMGGDFIYRWGNPSNYGAAGTQIIPAACHDPRWIPAGRPYAGYIQFWNNEGVSSSTSAVDLILAPESGSNYTLSAGSAYAPTTYTKRHITLDNSTGQSASDRMSNGNIFVAVSGGYMYEVDSNDNLVWQYNASPAKAFRYECDHPGIAALLGSNPCGLASSVDELTNADIVAYPNPSNGIVSFKGMELSNQYEMTVYDSFGKFILSSKNENSINLENAAPGIYMVNIVLDGSKLISKKITIVK